MSNDLVLDSSVAETGSSSRRLILIGFFITLTTLLVTLRETELTLFVLWNESFEYGHGLLVAPISVYLLWLRRARLARCPIEPDFIGVLMTALLVGLWVVSSLLGILIGEQIVLVLLLVAIIYAVLGRKMAGLCAIPIFFLFLAVPFWTYLNPVLQAVSATMSTKIVRAVGVPIFNEGLYLTIPGGRFLVAEVCSGLRYLLASLTLGSLFAVMNLGTVKYRVILFVTGIALGIVFNWIRVAIIVSSGHFLGMDSLLVRKHVWLGWLLFVVVSVLLVMIGNYFQSREEKNASKAAAGATDEHTDANADENPNANAKANPTKLSAFYSLVSITLLAGGAWLAASAQAPIRPMDFNLGRIDISEYRSVPEMAGVDWSPEFRNPDAVDQKIFRSAVKPETSAVNLYVAYYQRQRQGAEVVNDSNALFDKDVWIRTALRAVPDQVAVSRDLAVEEFVIAGKNTRAQRLIWRFYWVSGRYASTGIDAKLKQIAGLVQAKNSAAGIVLSTPVTVSLDRSRQELKRFLENGLEPLSGYLSSLDRSG